MATKRVIPDTDFGQIIIRTRTTARNISMRTKPDGLHVTVPPYCLTSKVMSVIEEYRPRLLEKWEKLTPQPLDLNFRIDAPCFRLRLEQGRFSRFTLRTDEEGITICCPPNVDFSLKSVQDLLRHCQGIEEECPKLSSTFIGGIGHAIRLQIQTSENYGKQEPLGQLFSHWKHQPVLLSDVTSSALDGLRLTPRTYPYKRNEPRTEVLGNIG